MKKMSISKRGFTLTEIIVVVAIMVIVASAAFVGIAVTINRANDTSARLQRENGNSFEKDAWTAVDNITEGAAKFFDISNYKPKIPTNTPTPTATPTPVPTQATVNTPIPTKAASNTNTPTPPPTNTPTPPPTNTPKPTTATGGVQPGVLSTGTPTGQVSFNSYTQSSLGFNASAKNAKKIVVEYDVSGAKVTSVDNWGHLGSAAPKITITDKSVKLEFDVAGMQDWQKSNMMNNSPQFRSGGDTVVKIKNVTMT